MPDESAIKELCDRVSREPDREKAAELLCALRQAVELENDETRLRIRQILLHYRHLVPMPRKPRNSVSSFVAALISGVRQSAHHGN